MGGRGIRCPDCGEYHGIYKPWHGPKLPTNGERVGMDEWLSSLESVIRAIEQRRLMLPDQIDRYARLARQLARDVTTRVRGDSE